LADLTQALRKLIVCAGGNAQDLRVPLCRKPVQVRFAQVGEAQVVVVEPRAPGALPARSVTLGPGGQVLAESVGQQVRLHGVVTRRADQTWWLFLSGAWGVPLWPQSPEATAALQQRCEQAAVACGRLTAQGLLLEYLAD